jgi:dTDP-4-dehydrorhamnose reductase
LTRILITGAAGQVGAELARIEWPESFVITALTRGEMDICDTESILRALESVEPDIVVNAAAYTAVDKAEEEAELAYRINATGSELLARATALNDVGLIHISTDYVFDGTKDGWYVESDETNPTGVYGASKLAGEEPVLTMGGMVLRTSWVYGALGLNFVRTMRKLGSERPSLNVVADQFGCPTAAIDIARAIRQILSVDDRPTGLFHMAAPDDASWWDLAVASIDGLVPKVEIEVAQITTAEYPTLAARPQNSRLNSDRLFEAFGVRLQPWRKALAEVTHELNQEVINSQGTGAS